MIHWEEPMYELVVDSFPHGPVTHIYFTEEKLKQAIKEYGPQVVSFKKVFSGNLVAEEA